MKQAFFFDVDDTLCATGPLHAQAFNQALFQLGIQRPNFLYSDYEGLSTEKVFEVLIGDDKKVKVASQLKREIFRASVSLVAQTEGAEEILEFLSQKEKKNHCSFIWKFWFCASNLGSNQAAGLF